MNDKFEYGKVYFTFGYLDTDFKFPVITSLVYIGKDLDGDEGRECWFFQDVDSYLSRGAYTGNGTPISEIPIDLKEDTGQIFTFSIDSIGEILEPMDLIDELRKIKN